MNIFVSRPNWTPPGVSPHMQEFYDTLSHVGFQPKTIGTNVVPMSSPFEEVRSLMQQCKGTIVLGLHQIVAKDVKVKGVEQGGLILPTEWNQIEATMSLMLNKPTLVLLHDNVAARGIFDRGAANVFVHSFNAQRAGWASKITPALLALKERIAP